MSEIDRRAIPAHAREGEWRAADGFAVRRIDWPWPAPDDAPQRGRLLMLGGRADGYEKFLEPMEEWHRAGWQVSWVDWRGQAGSGRMAASPKVGHIEDFSIWVDDLEQFWREWRSDPDFAAPDGAPCPLVIGAHSMGAHITLRTLAEHKIDPDAAFFAAPMFGFAGGGAPTRLMHLAANIMLRIGDPQRPAWKWSETPGTFPEGRMERLTHDAARYADEEWWINTRPELDMGPGSWRWMERALASMRSLEQPGVLEAVTTPILILAARHDQLVSYDAAARTAQRLPQAELISYGEEARHEILREADGVRRHAMAAIAAFLGKHSSGAGGGARPAGSGQSAGSEEVEEAGASSAKAQTRAQDASMEGA